MHASMKTAKGVPSHTLALLANASAAAADAADAAIASTARIEFQPSTRYEP